MKNLDDIQRSYEIAKKKFQAFGVNTDQAIEDFSKISVSLHCWQGDDVKGFEKSAGSVSQNIVTGNYPGAARNATELRKDIEKAFEFSPLSHRVNLHSIYAENDGYKPRSEVDYSDFEKWVEWAKSKGYGLDFNASFFTHEMINNGFSLASLDRKTRDYWIKVGKGAREISNQIGKELKSPCVNNIWIPDGLKDIPASRLAYRQYLQESLDEIMEIKYDKNNTYDVLEGKLFGIGTESFVVGSHEFYLGYAVKNGCGICMDTGHYHPTESVSDKVSAVILFVEHLMLHISRGIRWDSDHVVIQSDELTNLMLELKRGDLFGKVALGLDFFDASINRVAAWIIGLRALGKAILTALLEPTHIIVDAEKKGDFTARLAMMEEFKNLPVNAVWDKICLDKNIEQDWLSSLKKYEAEVQFNRN